MTLYSITFDLTDTRTEFIPTIPETAGDTENKTIPRICMSDSVEKCISAIASCNRNMQKGSQFIVRVFNIPNTDNLVSPRFLKESGYVPDALENNEYWYIKPIKATLYLCRVESFDYEFTLAWSCITREQCISLIEKYTNNKRFRRYKTSKGAYNAFMNWCNKYHKWDEMDNIWEDLAMLPWAQRTEIYNLKSTVIKQLNNR